jgi:hypothetical protein
MRDQTTPLHRGRGVDERRHMPWHQYTTPKIGSLNKWRFAASRYTMDARRAATVVVARHLWRPTNADRSIW